MDLLANVRPQKSPYANSQLDNVMVQLDTEMSKHGISTVPKGECSACGKYIVGQVVIAVGKMWHPEHFCCSHCDHKLGNKNFFERTGQAYCEKDYHELFSPKCATCNGTIRNKCITAMDRTWHPEHFSCTQCGKLLGEQGFHEKDGRPYCRQDFFSLFAPKCRGCGKAIMTNFITAFGSHWHSECFVCQECGKGFSKGAFFEYKGAPYCELHYHHQRGSICFLCSAPITGRCVSAMGGKKFHPEHFICVLCRRQLTKGNFKELDGRPCCHECYHRRVA